MSARANVSVKYLVKGGTFVAGRILRIHTHLLAYVHIYLYSKLLSFQNFNFHRYTHVCTHINANILTFT